MTIKDMFIAIVILAIVLFMISAQNKELAKAQQVQHYNNALFDSSGAYKGNSYEPKNKEDIHTTRY